jgi:uncharacterized protein YegP (UPF0339 family)
MKVRAMTGPRFFFVARVHDADEAADGGPAMRVGWRLLGRNNHEMARSAEGFADVSAAHDAVEEIQRGTAALEPSVSVTGPHGQWTWSLNRDGHPVVVASRTYRREREAVQSLEHFEETAPEAAVTGGLRDRPDARRLVRPEFVLGPRAAHPPEEDDPLMAQDTTGLPAVVELDDQDGPLEWFTGPTSDVQVEASRSSSRPATVSPVITQAPRQKGGEVR